MVREAILMSTVDLIWRKSSRSGQGGNGNCVEVAWRKSSYSGQGDNGDQPPNGWHVQNLCPFWA